MPRNSASPPSRGISRVAAVALGAAIDEAQVARARADGRCQHEHDRERGEGAQRTSRWSVSWLQTMVGAYFVP